MKKQLQLFLTRDDESELSRLLKTEFSDLRFLNDNVWRETPDCQDGIENCDSGRVYLYRGSLDQLPTARRKTGEIEGPIAGCVIQILRSLEMNDVLLSGRVAAGFDDNDLEMRQFASIVWKCVKSVGTQGVVRPDGRTDKNYLVGRHARVAAVEGLIRIADRAVRMEYVPVT